MDASGEGLSDYAGALNFINSMRASVNLLLSQSDYGNMPCANIDRNEWIMGYRDCVARSPIRVAPLLARRIIQISVAELNVDFFLRHIAKPK